MHRLGEDIQGRQHRKAVQASSGQEHRPQDGLRLKTSLRDIESKHRRPHLWQLKRPARAR